MKGQLAFVHGCPLIFQNIRLPELAPCFCFLLVPGHRMCPWAQQKQVAEASSGRSLRLSG